MNGLPQPAYVMSEPHLTGYRVIIGYETLADAQTAQSALTARSSEPGGGAVEPEWSYHDDDLYPPRPFWHVRLNWKGWSTDWTTVGRQEQKSLSDAEKAEAVAKLLATTPHPGASSSEPAAARGGEASASGCGYSGYEFGGGYPDSTCIDGYLWDLDSCDEPGGGLTHGGDIPCPKCNPAPALSAKGDE